MKSLLLSFVGLLALASSVNGQCPYPPVYYDVCPPVYYYYPQFCEHQPIYRVPAYLPPAPAPVSVTPTKKVDPPPQKVPFRTIENLRPVSINDVKPMTEFSEEIRSSYYVKAQLPDGTVYRVPIINGLAPNIWIGHHNGKLEEIRYRFTNPAAGKFSGQEGDSLTYKSVPSVPCVRVSTIKDDGLGGKVEEIHDQYINSLYVPDRLIKNNSTTRQTRPDDLLRRPSDIAK